MTGEDRELVDELAILNRDMVPLAVGIMESTAGAAEQVAYGDRLIAVGKRLQRWAHQTAGIVIGGEVLANGSLTFPSSTAEACRER
ncbi:MAG: hypothetical protein ACRDRU_17855 [Pseudonocardiaceae bacterium]